MERIKLLQGVSTVYTNYNFGSDEFGDGTASAPFKTANYALSYALNSYDFNGLNQTQLVIKLADGVTDYHGVHFPPHAMVGAQGFDAITLSGGAIHSSDSSAVGVYFGAVLRLKDIRLSSSSQNGLDALYGAKIKLDNVTFGACQSAAVNIDGFSCVMQSGAVTLDGQMQYYITSCTGRYQRFGQPISINSSMNMNSFVYGSGSGMIQLSGQTINLNGKTVTGKRYTLNTGASLDVGGAGVNYLPGNQAGTSNGGYYG